MSQVNFPSLAIKPNHGLCSRDISMFLIAVQKKILKGNFDDKIYDELEKILNEAEKRWGKR